MNEQSVECNIVVFNQLIVSYTETKLNWFVLQSE